MAIFRRACPPGGTTGPECEKPVSTFLTNVVPAVVMGIVVLISLSVLFFLVRRQKRRQRLEDAKGGNRESLEIEIDGYDSTAVGGGRPFLNNSHPPNNRPVYPESAYDGQSELSLPSSNRRGPSASMTSFEDTEFNKGPPYHASPLPPRDHRASKGPEELGPAQSGRALV